MAFLGPLKKTLNYELLPGADFIVVNFTLNGFYRLFQADVNKISEYQLLDPDTILDDNLFCKLWQQISRIQNKQKRIALVTSFLHRLLNDNTISLKNEIIENSHAFNNSFIHPVKAISKMLGKSERTVQLRFRRQFGYSTKERTRFNRFNNLLSHLIGQKKKEFNWAQLALQFGYYDQSHMLKDFNQYLGLSPQSFIKNRESFCIIYQRV